MSTHHRGRRAAAAAVAASLALGGAVALAPTAAVAVPPTDGDYFADTIPGLRAGSVFESVTFERFESILGLDGTFAFVLGDPDDATFAASATHIDAVAQQYGVEDVYVFNPLLDGESVDLRTFATGAQTEGAAGDLYTRLVTNYLNKDTTPQFGSGSDPYLFIYDKGHTAGGAEDRIVASLGAAVDAASVDTVDEQTAYRAQVAGVFDTVATAGHADLDTQSQFEFISTAVNNRHRADYGSQLASYGDYILTDEDAADFVVKSITYPELIHLLDSEGEHTILFGGTWCHNTRAVIKDVNKRAAESGIDTVYFFDLRLDGKTAVNAHIRDTASSISHLYGDLVAEYLPGLRTQYRLDSTTASHQVQYFPGGDTSLAKVKAPKLQVPYLIEYDRDAAAPVTKDWIKDNGDGTFREFMTEWWWVADLQGPAQRQNQTAEQYAAARATNLAFADEAITALDTFFGTTPETPAATAPEAPASPTVSVTGADVTVAWTAPADGGSAITGYTVSLGSASATVAAGVTSHTFTGVAAGAHVATVTATNAVGSSAASVPSSIVVSAPAGPGALPETGGSGDADVDEAPAPKITVTGDVRPGGTVTVRGTGLAAGSPSVRVELHSTPIVLGTTTASAGAFTLTATIPTSVPAGAHTVVVFVDGVQVATSAVTLAAAPGTGLAATGANGLPFLAAGFAVSLVAAGAVLLVARRRVQSQA